LVLNPKAGFRGCAAEPEKLGTRMVPLEESKWLSSR
jgi:hypothetical protein